ncbi:MAG: hypothetical protein IPH13_18585 [Planctomycetes bacterium]|nr:hypothetical protein [Planctomycetota bacterium]
MAKHQLRGPRGRGTFGVSDLVQEAYLRLLRADLADTEHVGFRMRAALAMRSAIVDHARTRGREKRNPELGPPVPDAICDTMLERSVDVFALEPALDELETMDPVAFKAIHVRFYTGATIAEVAEALGLPLRTTERKLATTIKWLRTKVR